MCPLCIATIALTVTAKTGAAAAVVATATRVAKSVKRPSPAGSGHDAGGER